MRPGIPRPSTLLRKVPFPYRAASRPASVRPGPLARRTGVDYETAWARRYPARVVRLGLLEGVLRPAVRMLASPQRSGLDRLHGIEGPVVFAANHHSHVDTPLLLTSIPERWRDRVVVGAAADHFFATRPSGALWALAVGAIPVERLHVSRRSARLAAELLEDGWSLVLFPEGGRSPDGWGQPFRGGAAYLSVRTGRPVVPVHVAGTGRILPKGRRRPRPGRATVTFGTPLRPEEGEQTRTFAERIEASVAALGDEATTDWWSARRRQASGETPTLRGPAFGGWRRAWALGGVRPRAARRWPPER